MSKMDMEEEEEQLILCKSGIFSVLRQTSHRDFLYIFLSATRELDSTGAPRPFRKDELLQFLRVCSKQFK